MSIPRTGGKIPSGILTIEENFLESFWLTDSVVGLITVKLIIIEATIKEIKEAAIRIAKITTNRFTSSL